MIMFSRDRERRRMYNKSKLGSAKAQLRIVSQSYGDMVRTFLFQVDIDQLGSISGGPDPLLLLGGPVLI